MRGMRGASLSSWRGVDELSGVGGLSAVAVGSAMGSDRDAELAALKVMVWCSPVDVSISFGTSSVALAVSARASRVS